MNSKNKTLQLCYNLAIKGNGSYVSNSINYIASIYKVNKYSMCSMNVNKHNIDIDIIIKKADAIRDFISMHEDIDTSALDKRNITSIIDFLCTS